MTASLSVSCYELTYCVNAVWVSSVFWLWYLLLFMTMTRCWMTSTPLSTGLASSSSFLWFCRNTYLKRSDSSDRPPLATVLFHCVKLQFKYLNQAPLRSTIHSSLLRWFICLASAVVTWSWVSCCQLASIVFCLVERLQTALNLIQSWATRTLFKEDIALCFCRRDLGMLV